MTHPLIPTRRVGQVISYSPTPEPTVEVTIGGDTSTTDFVPFLGSYPPAVNDYVMLLGNQGDYVAIGAPATTTSVPAAPNMHVQQFSYADFSSGTRAFMQAIDVAIPIPPAAADGTRTISVQLMHHVAMITAASNFILDLSTADSGWTAQGDMGSAFPNMSDVTTYVGDFTIIGLWTVPAGATSLTPRLNGQRTAGTGALRSAGGYSIWQWWFK